MQISKTLISALLQLVNGESIAASSLRRDIAEAILGEGLITVRSKGSRRTFSAIDKHALRNFLASKYEELRDLEGALSLCEGLANRADQASMSGNSKLVMVRSCPGFPVNSYVPIHCELNKEEFIVNPKCGSFLFVSDWGSFTIPKDVIIVGIENMENFRKIRQQKYLFDSIGENLLFVSRYPQSTDLRLWLESIPNQYIHFGDFDLAGIHIFLTEFHKFLGGRSSFFIPDDIEKRLKYGSSTRYNDQYYRFSGISTDISELQSLIDMINRYHRCYDQEGYIL